MEKREEFKEALKESLKAKDKVTMSTVRLILAALKDKDISVRATGNEDGISDQEILSMLQSMIKQRNESIKTYEDAGRLDMAEQEAEEIKVIERFLPKQLSEDEAQAAVKGAVEETGASEIKDMGKVMGILKQRYAGQLDMGKAGAMVKQQLAG